LIRSAGRSSGQPSVYELTPLMWELLGQTPGQAQKGPSEARPAVESIAAGPETVPPAEPAGEASPSDLVSLPEDDHPQDDACAGA
jgi:hypothetical protein